MISMIALRPTRYDKQDIATGEHFDVDDRFVNTLTIARIAAVAPQDQSQPEGPPTVSTDAPEADSIRRPKFGKPGKKKGTTKRAHSRA